MADRVASTDGALRVRLSSFVDPPDPEADILVDWTPEFENPSIDWPVLLAARDDLKHELARTTQAVEVDAQARLTAAFAFGHAFPAASRIDLVAIANDGSRWMARGAGAPSAVVVQETKIPTGNPTVATVEVSLARQVAAAATRAVASHGLNPALSLAIGLADGVHAVDSEVAAAAAACFGERLRNLRDQGVLEAHILLAAPAAAALLLGASVNAGPDMVVYYLREGAYAPAVRLKS